MRIRLKTIGGFVLLLLISLSYANCGDINATVTDDTIQAQEMLTSAALVGEYEMRYLNGEFFVVGTSYLVYNIFENGATQSAPSISNIDQYRWFQTWYEEDTYDGCSQIGGPMILTNCVKRAPSLSDGLGGDAMWAKGKPGEVWACDLEKRNTKTLPVPGATCPDFPTLKTTVEISISNGQVNQLVFGWDEAWTGTTLAKVVCETAADCEVPLP